MSIERFVLAQEKQYENALAELSAGYKKTHWMWYIFPQLNGLGISHMSIFYGIKNLDEAKDYLNHSLLSERMYSLCNVLLSLESNNIEKIMGTPDCIKLQSSLTLFKKASQTPEVFQKLLDKFYSGQEDGKTNKLLE